jgi:hypothetical protein
MSVEPPEFLDESPVSLSNLIYASLLGTSGRFNGDQKEMHGSGGFGSEERQFEMSKLLSSRTLLEMYCRGYMERPTLV